MKIYHISSYYIGSNLYKKLMYALDKNGISNRVYAFVQKNYVPDREFDGFVDIRKTHVLFDRLNFVTKHKKTERDFYKYIDENGKPDIFHAHSLVSNGFIAYQAFKKYKVPYVVAVRDTDVNTFYKKIFFIRPLARKILDNASKVIFISSPYRDFAVQNMTNDKEKLLQKSHIVVNGIDELFLRNVKSKSYDKNIIKIIFVGTIDKRKNITTTIKACEELISHGHKVEFHVIGKPCNQEFETILDKPFIRFTPHVEQKELLNIYQENDIFVMPSITETFGLVYAEAMSQGLPVIYTRGQGFDGNFVDGEVGYAVKHDDFIDIADKILKIRENYDQMSENCVKGCKKFNWDLIAEEYLNIYKDILN